MSDQQFLYRTDTYNLPPIIWESFEKFRERFFSTNSPPPSRNYGIAVLSNTKFILSSSVNDHQKCFVYTVSYYFAQLQLSMSAELLNIDWQGARLGHGMAHFWTLPAYKTSVEWVINNFFSEYTPTISLPSSEKVWKSLEKDFFPPIPPPATTV